MASTAGMALHYSKGRGRPRVKMIRRRCLKCDDTFMAEGRFNRICPKCAETNRHIDTSSYRVVTRF